MAFCQNCGRLLGENEVCTCTSGNSAINLNKDTAAPPPIPGPAPSPAPTPQAPPPAPGMQTPPPPAPNMQTPPPANRIDNTQAATININGAQPAKKKGGLWWIWLIIIPIVLVILLVLGLLAAILVPTMIGYNKKAKVTSMNASAVSVYKAGNSALTEMDEEGDKISGYYIICSNEKYNYNVPKDNFDLDKFYKKVNNFYADSKDGEWFVICEYGYISYSAFSEDWSSDIVGTYPNSATTDGASYYQASSYSTKTKASLTRLYNDAAPKVKSLAESYSSYLYY